MKRFYLLPLLLTLLAAALPSWAQTCNIGYCSGEKASEGAFTVDGNTWVSGAIYLPAENLEYYRGGKLTDVRAAVTTKLNVDSVIAWVRTDLNGPDLAQGIITLKTEPKIARGWNTIPLAESVEIGGQGLYIGFSYHQKKAAGVFSAVGIGTENTFFVKLSPDGAWEDGSSMGMLSLEGVVEGISAPEYDLGITSATASPATESGLYDITANMVNNGSKAISGFTLAVSGEDGSKLDSRHFDIAIEPAGRQEVKFQVPTAAGALFVSIDGIDGATDQIAYNDRMQAQFTFTRRVLVEEYTTEQCSNCPRVASQLHNVLGREKYQDKIIAVCHHAGYYTDFLTQPCDQEMVDFFGVPGCPYMAFDRAPLFGVGAYASTVTCPALQDIMDNVDKRLAEPSAVTLAIDLEYDPERKNVNVNITGERNAVFGANSTITVYLVEDEIAQRNQSGISGYPDFMHSHVIRQYNSTWGEPIKWDMNTFTYGCQFSLDREWNADKMQVVAVVANYNPDNKLDCVVENSASAELKSNVVAIEDTADGLEAEVAYYDLMGRRVANPANGLFIEVANGQARKVRMK